MERAPPVNSEFYSDSMNSSVVTPVVSANVSRNKRWYNNKLSATSIDLVLDITSKTLPKLEEDASSKMHKQVMKRLMLTDSPPSKRKMMCFRKMANDDKEAKTTISLTVEMDLSIDQAKRYGN